MFRTLHKLIAVILVFLMAVGVLPVSPMSQGDRAYALGGGMISTVAGNGTQGYSGDGAAATEAQINAPTGVAVDGDGSLYLSEYWHHTVRKVDINGNITTVAGNGTAGFSGDEGPATEAQLNFPGGIAVDDSGDLYIADTNNKRIRKVDLTTGIISTVAGDGNVGPTGNGGPATSAALSFPSDVAVDGSGNLYIAEGNASIIRKVDAATGNISTVAGNLSPAYSGDGGPATAASLKYPNGITVDDNGNLYIADTSNHVVRKVDAAGNITTLAGTGGSSGFSGDGGAATAAKLNKPSGVAVDSSGNLYIADNNNFCIRMVDTDGNISTVAGVGKSSGYSGDGGLATEAKMAYPEKIAIDSEDNLYIADGSNHRVRMVTGAAPASGTVAAIYSQLLTALVQGYAEDSQETRTITIRRTGAGDLANLAAALSGADADNFEITQPADTVLNDATTATTFTVKAKDGLAEGTYRATVTVSADDMTDVTFKLSQVVYGESGYPSWIDVGSDGFSDGRVTDTSLAFDSSGTPYVVYQDEANDNKATVMKYDGTDWVVVGNAGFSTDSVDGTGIAIDSSDTPYVVYGDWNGAESKATVMKYDGTDWVPVGSAGFSAGAVEYTRIVIDSSDTPYVVYRDGANGNKATVMKYDGTEWDVVGSTGFSAGAVEYTKIVIDSSGTPYVVYKDVAHAGKATVMKFDGTSWGVVGSVGFSSGQTWDTSIAIDTVDAPLVAYRDEANNGKATVMKYDGTEWVVVGSAGFSAGIVSDTSIVIDGSDMPYVAYNDGSQDGKATVMKFDGMNWVNAGDAGFSAGEVWDVSIVFDSSGMPYVAYRDGGRDAYATVMKLGWADPYTIEIDGDLTLLPLEEGYAPDSQENKMVVVQRTGAGDLINLATALSGADAANFELTQPVDTELNDDVTETQFWIKAKDGLAAGTYTVSVTVSADNMTDVTFTVTQEVTEAEQSARSWIDAGSADFPQQDAQNRSIAIGSSGMPYVIFRNSTTKATVMRYDGTGWNNVGNANFTSAYANYLAIAINGSDTPYIAYADGINGSKATVMKYDGTNWVVVGSAFSPGMASNFSIAFDSSGTPYVAYLDTVNSSKVTVKKYDGTNWVTVGSAGFSSAWAAYPKIAMDSNDTPYVLYGDYNGTDARPTVKKYNGTSWVNVGSARFSAGEANAASMAIDNSDIPYVVYKDAANGNKATVMKYDGTSWGVVGSAGFSAGSAEYVGIVIDSSGGTPYVAYSDSSNAGRATVMSYDGTSWAAVGSAGFSVGSVFELGIAIDSGSDTPYVVFLGNNSRTAVMKYAAATYTVAYNGNGSTGGNVPTDNYNYEEGDSITVLGNTGALTRTGYTFAGWNTAANGSGTSYAANDTFNIGAANVTLYAQWTELPAEPPAEQPMNLTLSSNSNNNVVISFTASESADNYVIVRRSAGEPSFVPVNGTGYSAGVQGADEIIFVGPEVTCTDATAQVDQDYFYTVYAFNGSGASAAYLTEQPLKGRIKLQSGQTNAGITVEAAANSTSAGYPEAGVNINFPQGVAQETSLSVSKAASQPAANFYVQPNVRRVSPLYFEIVATPQAPGNYILTLDFSSLGLSESQWNNFVVMKRNDANSSWVNVEELGAVIENRQTDGVWGKFTISGLSSFSQFAGGESAETHTVTSAADAGEGTLRNALEQAVAGDIIQFDVTEMGAQVITLSSPIVINKDITIRGAGNGIVLDGNNAVRVLTITDGSVVRVESMLIQNGKDDADIVGGILNEGQLTLVNGVISGNKATGIAGGYGGVGGILQEVESVLVDGLPKPVSLVLINSTIAGNAGAESAGGVGGVGVFGGEAAIYNSIISGNTGEDKEAYFDAGIDKSYNSLFGFGNDEFEIGAGNNNLFAVDPMFLGTGEHPYQLSNNSPAIGAGDNGYIYEQFDVRGEGFGRKTDSTDGSEGTVDIGAYEKEFVPTYTLSYDGSGSTGGSVPTDNNTYEAGVQVTVAGNTENLVKTGYTFAGWNTAADGSGTAYVAADTFNMGAANVILYAKWTINQYNVTYKDYDGTTLKTETVEHGSDATAPANPARTGYTFTGWDTAFGNVTGNLTVTAQYSINQYTVSFDSSGGSTIDGITADYGITITEPAAPTKEGYAFGGWYKEAELENVWEFGTDTVAAENITLYAQWAINQYTVTFNDYNGTTLKTETLDHGSDATAPANPARTGYTFTSWDTAFGNVTGSLTVNAQYSINQYSVSFNSNGGSAVDGIIANYDSVITAPAAPTKEGYDFAGWYKEDTLTNAWAFDTDAVPAQDITLYAGWTIKEYTVTFKDYNGTTLKTETLDHGSDATAPANPARTGYTFTGWDMAFGNVTGNLTVTAQYSVNQYMVSFNSNGGSAVDGIIANYDSTITEPAAPAKEGYAFGGWYKEAKLENAWKFGTDTVVAENITLYAQWTANNYTVTYDSNGSTGGAVPIDGVTYHYTDSVTVLGNSGNLFKRNHTFAGWNTHLDGSGTDYAAAATFNIGAVDVTLYAQWIEDPSDGGSSPSTTTPAATTPGTGGVEVIVNGKAENAGTATTTTEGDKTTTNIAVDAQKLEQKLASERDNVLVTIPVNTKADVVIGELNGQMVKNMENKQAILEVKTETAAYTIPSKQINISAISEQIGKNVELKDIKVQVVISKAAEDTVKIVQNSAKQGDFTIVAPPMEFAVKYTHENKTVEVSNFNSYVERTVAIPEGVDPAKITTGVVIEADGTVRHVPTKIVVLDGKYYAKINSLTNSTYSVVWHPKEFKDAEQHWAKEAINDLGSRMVISGVGDDMFMPDRDITRAEFAAIVVKALGLKQGTGKNIFADVKTTDWYGGFIETAYEQGIISGYGNGKFAPGAKVTREEAMTMIARVMKITGLKVDYTIEEAGSILAEYGDSNTTAQWAKTSVASCVKSEIVTGKGGKKLALKDEITRGEVAMIVRILLQKSALI